MRDSHLCEAEHHDDRNERCDRVTDEHCRAGIADGDATAHEEARSDRTAYADYRDLAL
nr:hypothetical protein [Paraburkholderia mimosarum]